MPDHTRIDSPPDLALLAAQPRTHSLSTEQRTLLGVLGVTVKGVAEGWERPRIYSLEDVWHLTQPLNIAPTLPAFRELVQHLSAWTQGPSPAPFVYAMAELFTLTPSLPNFPLGCFTPFAHRTMGCVLLENGMHGMPTLSELATASRDYA